MPDFQLDIENMPIVEVATDTLILGFSPRLSGPDEQTVRALAELDQPLPPLLVRRQTNGVIDGMHRLLAARRRGQETIEVRYHDCDEASAFVLAVHANVAHGLPLSLRDRKAAAARILLSHAHWSDRRIAAVTGLSDKTIAAIRGRTMPREAGDAVSPRVGLDGRARPVDAATRRVAVAKLLTEDPDSPLRRIAGLAGVSPDTVRAVKADLRGGEEKAAGRRRRAPRALALDTRQCLHALANDPALRSTDAGRLLLRILSTLALIERDSNGLVECVPEHDLAMFRRLAMANAEAWRSMADRAVRRGNAGVAQAERASVS